MDGEKLNFNLVPRVLETRLTELFENADVACYRRRPFSMEQRVERDKKNVPFAKFIARRKCFGYASVDKQRVMGFLNLKKKCRLAWMGNETL